MRPWLWIPPQWAHDLSPYYLKVRGRVFGGEPEKYRTVEFNNLIFPNPVGIAGGVDKNGECLSGWWSLGAGFIEIGTITPKPQSANPGKIMDRNSSKLAVWNKMGFPSKGLVQVKKNLLQISDKKSPTPIFANIGKNRETPNPQASQDYIMGIQQLEPLVDGFVVNISSPNTAGLRELLQPEALKKFLTPIILAKKTSKPILLKLSPDISTAQLKQVLNISMESGINGWILTNTTSGQREGLGFNSDGGVSGQPLADLAKKMLKETVHHLGVLKSEYLIVSSGGILSPEQVEERLQMGADLVQVYAALIFSGPHFFKNCTKYFKGK